MTSTLEIGDAVRVSLPGALFLHGDIQDVNESSVKVRGRWFPVETVKTEEQIEDEKHEARRAAWKISDVAPAATPTTTYSKSFLALWEEAKTENKLRAQRVDVAAALEQAYRDDISRTRSGRRAVKKAAVQWLITDTTESRLRLFSHIKARGALAIEPTPETLSYVAYWYTALCGERFPEENGETVHIVPPLCSSRGTEYRVSFPLPEFDLPEQFNYQTMFAGGAGRLVINSKELFELMVTEGMRL